MQYFHVIHGGESDIADGIMQSKLCAALEESPVIPLVRYM